METVKLPTLRTPVPRQDIIYMKADGNYTYVFLKGRAKPLLISITLKRSCQQAGLLRIHKQFAINQAYVQKYNVDAQQESFVLLTNGVQLSVSRRVSVELKNQNKENEQSI